ncbi:DNA-(apurinic or apyrimidinic site) endonuclease-like [Neopsephotus bourkii]|uniref:DNA-(apurinic or apyrimidinic site) endonuclease-like n=1 Tax=Neopsephotus bourkii TaxID=309878 RepID=UPI002AA59153|nr:DNA-(apurinic or apyrimidinic site) endonuclease-like [Neopsephotus bourkii]XP_061218134.1 DNA-(apurinic or apyrimidinic site) endonuclease-like [Neopsephotus bourkii]
MPKRAKKEAPAGEEGGPGGGKRSRDASVPLPPETPVREVAPSGKRVGMRLVTWNVAGLRGWLRKGGLQWVQEQAPDVLCLQETKCGAGSVPPEVRELRALPHQYWASPEGRPGYSGVGLLCREEPMRVTYGIDDPEHDPTARVITAEFPSLFVVCAYVPNAGRGLTRLEPRLRFDASFRSFLSRLDALKPVAIGGDLNVAHTDLDLRHPSTNRRSPGFTNEERSGLSALLDAGFVDAFRVLNPGLPHAYTFWTYLGGARERNVGWRLDYFLLSRRLGEELCDCKLRPKVMGSDHCPVELYLAV